MGLEEQWRLTTIREGRMGLLSVTDICDLLTKMKQLAIKIVIMANKI